MKLADVAPRLALARDQLVAERLAMRARERWLVSRRHELDKLVAHRELQLLRAGARGSRRYIARRQSKLDAARAARARLEDRP